MDKYKNAVFYYNWEENINLIGGVEEITYDKTKFENEADLFIFEFGEDLSDLEQDFDKMTMAEVEEDVRDYLHILEKEGEDLMKKEQFIDFKNRLESLLIKRKKLGNLDQPVRFSKEELDKNREFLSTLKTKLRQKELRKQPPLGFCKFDILPPDILRNIPRIEQLLYEEDYEKFLKGFIKILDESNKSEKEKEHMIQEAIKIRNLLGIPKGKGVIGKRNGCFLIYNLLLFGVDFSRLIF